MPSLLNRVCRIIIIHSLDNDHTRGCVVAGVLPWLLYSTDYPTALFIGSCGHTVHVLVV